MKDDRYLENVPTLLVIMTLIPYVDRAHFARAVGLLHLENRTLPGKTQAVQRVL